MAIMKMGLDDKEMPDEEGLSPVSVKGSGTPDLGMGAGGPAPVDPPAGNSVITGMPAPNFTAQGQPNQGATSAVPDSGMNYTMGSFGPGGSGPQIESLPPPPTGEATPKGGMQINGPVTTTGPGTTTGGPSNQGEPAWGPNDPRNQPPIQNGGPIIPISNGPAWREPTAGPATPTTPVQQATRQTAAWNEPAPTGNGTPAWTEPNTPAPTNGPRPIMSTAPGATWTTPEPSNSPAVARPIMGTPTGTGQPADSGWREPARAPQQAAQVGGGQMPTFAATPDMLVENRMARIMQSGNPLLEQALTKARQQANARGGTINSSMADQAGTEAMLNSAQSIAAQDANTYKEVGSTNFQAQVQSILQDKSLSAEAQNRMLDRAFQQEENATGRQFTSRENTLNRIATSADKAADRSFAAQQNQFQADVQQIMQDKSLTAEQQQAALQRAFQSQESAAGRTFTGQQNQFQADVQQIMQDKSISAEERAARLQRAFQSSESAANRTADSQNRAADRSFQSGESAANRNFTAEQNSIAQQVQQIMQDKSLSASERNAALERAYQSTERAADRSFTGSENAANRTADASNRQADRTFTAEQNAQAQRVQQIMQDKTLSAQDRNAALDREFQNAQNTSNRNFQADENAKQRQFQGDMTQQGFKFQTERDTVNYQNNVAMFDRQIAAARTDAEANFFRNNQVQYNQSIVAIQTSPDLTPDQRTAQIASLNTLYSGFQYQGRFLNLVAGTGTPTTTTTGGTTTTTPGGGSGTGGATQQN